MRSHRYRGRLRQDGFRASRGATLLIGATAMAVLAGCGSSGSSTPTARAPRPRPRPAPAWPTLVAGQLLQVLERHEDHLLGLGAGLRPGGERVQQDPPRHLRHPGGRRRGQPRVRQAAPTRSRPARARPTWPRSSSTSCPRSRSPTTWSTWPSTGRTTTRATSCRGPGARSARASAVYAMPSDSGPMGFYYNSKQLAKYHITPPTTWAQFAADAAKLHKANSSAYLTNFAGNDLQWVLSLMAQDGAFPFSYAGGSKVDDRLDRPGADGVRRLLAEDAVRARAQRGQRRRARRVRRHGQGHRRELAQLGLGPVLLRAGREVVGRRLAGRAAAAVDGRRRRRGQLGRLHLPGVLAERAPGAGGRVLRVADRYQRLVEHRQDAAVVAVPDLQAAAGQPRRSRTSSTRSPGRPPRTSRSPRPRRRSPPCSGRRS